MGDTINSYGGIVITGDAYGGKFESHNEVTNHASVTNNVVVTINDPIMIEKLFGAANDIRPEEPDAKEKVKELKSELNRPKPRVGKLQALYDWLRRNCTGENVLKAIKIFGELLILALK